MSVLAAMTCCCDGTGNLILRVAGLHVSRPQGGQHANFNGERPLVRAGDGFWLLGGEPWFNDEWDGSGVSFQIVSAPLRVPPANQWPCGQNWYIRLDVRAPVSRALIDYVAGVAFDPQAPHVGLYPLCTILSTTNMVVEDPGEIRVLQ